MNEWTETRVKLPDPDERVLTYSPEYKETDAMRYRIMDGQFVRICTDVTHWKRLESPE